MFTQKIRTLRRVIEALQMRTDFSTAGLEERHLREALAALKKVPTTFDDCVQYARAKFDKFFVHDIEDLLHVYPPERLNADGAPFWSLPKRAPKPLRFDTTNKTHVSFVTSCAALRALVFGLPLPTDYRGTLCTEKVA
jgi:hypothetical protein